MTPTDLARFAREELPRIQDNYDDWRWNHAIEADRVADHVPDMLDALTALLALLREVEPVTLPFLNLKDKGEYVLGVVTQENLRSLEALHDRLRAVVGREAR